MDLITVDGITKRYSNHLALSDISLSVPEKSIFGLLGPNGAGKTTLIRIINQIINSDSGSVFINGEKLKPEHVEIIGYLPEERGLYKKMKVGDQLLYFAQLKGLSAAEARKKIKSWLEKFEIADWWNKKVEELSKGMAQKIQFISTVVHEPSLIILDEPFSGFDPVNADLIKNEILELRDKGATVLFSTHRMESVEELCDYIALINHSKKILDGPKNEIKEEHKTNTFRIDHRGAFTGLNNGFEILEQQNVEDDSYYSLVRIEDGKNPNDLLKEVINLTEVYGLMELIPSINDIFISKVKDGKNE
jgi:ABC-2 type transport system ATP-binding protein